MAVIVSQGLGYGFALLLALPMAGLFMRLFMFQHDCGHGSFFSSRQHNDAVGRVIGVLTLMPYTYWRRTHGIHHATAGNLDRRGLGDIDTLTLREYVEAPWWRRFFYRFYRSTPVLLGIGWRLREAIGPVKLLDTDGWEDRNAIICAGSVRPLKKPRLLMKPASGAKALAAELKLLDFRPLRA